MVSQQTLSILTEAFRQGDPLSPYIYIICVEVLSRLLRKAQQDGLIQGVSIATNAPAISHLFYADDSILFCRAKIEEVETIMSILQLYQNFSGQKINLDKFEMIFSPNISHDFKKQFQESLHVKISDNIHKYLGMLLYIGFKLDLQET